MTTIGRDQPAPFQIRFLKDAFRPNKIRGRDLSVVISSVDEAVTTTVAYDVSQTDAAMVAASLERDLFVSLTRIRDDSTLDLTPTYPELTIPAWRKVIRAVDHDAYDHLSRRTTQAIRRIIKFTKDYDCPAELRSNDTGESAVAVLNPQTAVTAPPLVSGKTTLYGYLLRIGGRRPTVLIAPLAGGIVAARIDQAMAQSLAPRLYQWIGVDGTAEWNIQSLRIETFTVESIAPFTDTPITKAMHSIRDSYGHYFDDIEDVDSFTRDIRG